MRQSVQSDSINFELEGAFYVSLEGAPSLDGAIKIAQKGEKKDAFDVVVDGPLKGGCTHLFVR